MALQTGCSLARFFNYDKSNAVGTPRSTLILYYIDESDEDEPIGKLTGGKADEDEDY